MTKEEFDIAIKQVYDDLTKEQFDKLLQKSAEMLLIKGYGSLELAGKVIKNSKLRLIDFIQEMELAEHLDSLSLEVFKTVAKSRRISFKQFKMLSAFSKTDWLSEEQEEFKQF